MFIKIIILIISLLIISLYLIFRPNYDGLVLHDNKNYGTIYIKRDDAGIPHIKGKNVKDACFGQGFAHGQDRLFQIYLKNLIVNGQLSLIAGEKGLSTDKFFRTIGIHRISKKIADKLKGEQKECIQAYCDGLNTYYNQLKIKPLDFIIAQTEWKEFKPEDVIGQERLMYLLLGYDYVWETVRSNLAEQFGFEQAQFITAARSDAQFVDITIMDDQDLKNNNLFKKFERNISKNYLSSKHQEIKKGYKHENFLDSQIANIIDELYDGPSGSNAWVIHGNYTKSGKPLLASDPHLSSQMPTQWVQNEILIEDENLILIGASVPGIPLVQNGRSEFCSWGTTVLFADTADLYKETVKDNQYLLDGKWVPLQSMEELIYVKGQKEPYVHNVKFTHRGSILNHRFDKTAKDPLVEIGIDVSFVWTGQIQQSSAIDSLLAIGRAKKTQECLNAFKQMVGPVLSIVYATKSGDIGFYGYGKIPIIKDSVEGAFLKDGTTTESDWLRYTKPSENPQMMNPSKGFIVTANNRFASDNMVNHLSVNQLSTPRALRITQLIQQHIKKGLKFDIDDMKRIQSDSVDVYIQIILPHLINLYEKKGLQVLNNDEKLYQQGLKMINILRDWDSNLTIDSHQASIFMVWEYLFCQKSLLQFEASDLDRKTISMGFHFEHFYFKKIQQWSSNNQQDFDEVWCKTKQNENSKQSCLYNVIQSFVEVEEFLYQKFKTRKPEQWRWGELHRNMLPHQPFSKSILANIYNRQIEVQGNRRTIAVSIQNWKGESFDSAYGPNYRMVVDMDDKGQDYWILESGMSENIFSSHYDDQLNLHKNFKYLKMNRGFSNFEKDKKYSQELKYNQKRNERNEL